MPPEKTCELRNWANLSHVAPLSAPSPLRSDLGTTTSFGALYSGNLANKQGLEILPEMARLQTHRSDLTFAICGDGPMRAALMKAAKDIPDIRFFPLQPVEKLSELVGMADVHLLPQIKGAADLVLPSKLTNMLASGRPVIATAEPDTALGEEVSGAGMLVPRGDAVAASQALSTLLDDAALRRSLGQEARHRAEQRWDMAAILRRLQDEFGAVAQADV